MVELIPVVSSNLAAFGYDPDRKALFIRFRSGSGTYRYAGVPASVVEAFAVAGSKGQHFHRFIRNRYPYSRVA